MPTIKTLTEGVLILFFVTAIWLPIGDSFLDLDRADRVKENRRRARAPELTGGLELVKRFPEDFERYYNDHFGFRTSLIRGQCQVKYHLFDKSGSSGVVLGKGDWLFYATGRILDCYRGVDPFEPRELESWRLMLEARRDALAERGIRFLFLFVPNKHTVYPEFLPDRLNVVNETSRMDQLTAYLRENSDVEFIDLSDVLIQAKEEYQTFERTGTHWTHPGIYFSHVQIIERLQPWFPELEPVPLSTINILKKSGRHYGLSNMLGMEDELTEEVTLFRISPLRSQEVELDDNLRKLLQPRGRSVDVYEGSDPSLPRLMIVGDSFGERLGSVLANCFSRTIFAWHVFDLETIEREKPDLVIGQLVERILMRDHPPDMRKLRNLHLPLGN